MVSIKGVTVKNTSSSLDHGVLKNVEICTQDDGYKCGVFTLLMMMMGHKGEMRHLRRHYTSDKLTECCLRFFNLIDDMVKVIIPNNKFFYDREEHGVEKILGSGGKYFLIAYFQGMIMTKDVN